MTAAASDHEHLQWCGFGRVLSKGSPGDEGEQAKREKRVFHAGDERQERDDARIPDV